MTAKNILENILDTNYYVHNNSKHVKINIEEIKKLITNTKFSKSKYWLSNNPFGLLDLNSKDIVNFFIIFDSINCSFWGNPKWTVKTDDNELDGSFALMYSLLKLRNTKGHLNFEKISFEEFKLALYGNVDIPLLKERYKIVLEISKIINSRMNGDFYTYIKDINSDLELMHILVNNFPTFKDIRTYGNKEISFYKLAQLTTSDILHIRELKENIIVNYSNLVGCADYKIPQVLRALSILEYDEELTYLVDNKIEIPENSIYEVEIRANMIVAISIIKNELNNEISAIDINDIIWTLGQDKSRNYKPYHLTRTLSY